MHSHHSLLAPSTPKLPLQLIKSFRDNGYLKYRGFLLWTQCQSYSFIGYTVLPSTIAVRIKPKLDILGIHMRTSRSSVQIAVQSPARSELNLNVLNHKCQLYLIDFGRLQSNFVQTQHFKLSEKWRLEHPSPVLKLSFQRTHNTMREQSPRSNIKGIYRLLNLFDIAALPRY
jgi:hypothetical protein